MVRARCSISGSNRLGSRRREFPQALLKIHIPKPDNLHSREARRRSAESQSTRSTGCRPLVKRDGERVFCGMLLKPKQLIRRSVRQLHAYVPGEQPRIKGLIKLNTNENPYPPSPAVLDAVTRAVDSRLRLYPDPRASLLREKLAKLHGCTPANILVGNGSDELLALATRAFVEPQANPRKKTRSSQCTVQYLTPSYSRSYPVLAAIHDAAANGVALQRDFSLPAPGMLGDAGVGIFTRR